MQRIRIHFTKGEELQFTGHLDLHKIWERTFRRAHLPLAYSQGFHPQPRIQLACALPLGFTSAAEMADIWLDTDAPLDEIIRILVSTTQPGLSVKSIESVPLYETPLQNRVTSVVYKLSFLDPVDAPQLEHKAAILLEQSSITRERRGKTYDLRSLIEAVTFHQEESDFAIELQMAARPGATGRPEEFLEELGVDPFSVDIERTRIVLASIPTKESRS